MLAEQSLREGKVQEALEQLQDAVRSDPSSARYRIFLFQLLALLGQWKRALNQLNVSGDLDSANLAMVHAYRDAIQCEALRAEVFAGKRTPVVFGEPEQWIALMIEALRRTAEGQHAEAGRLRGEALELAPATPGTINGEAFEWISDADPRTGPLLEVVVEGRYTWVPFSRIHRIETEEPADLRDFVWTPAHLTWSNGGQSVGMIPTRYPGSESSEDGLVVLARKTDWQEVAPETQLGLGQRLLATDQADHPLLEAREIILDTLEEGATIGDS